RDRERARVAARRRERLPDLGEVFGDLRRKGCGPRYPPVGGDDPPQNRRGKHGSLRGGCVRQLPAAGAPQAERRAHHRAPPTRPAGGHPPRTPPAPPPAARGGGRLPPGRPPPPPPPAAVRRPGTPGHPSPSPLRGCSAHRRGPGAWLSAWRGRPDGGSAG